MRTVSFCFKVHQPILLRDYRFNQIGEQHDYFDDELSLTALRRISENCYIPTNYIISNLIKNIGNRFKVSFAISGTTTEQIKEHEPELFSSFQHLFDTENIELLSMPFYNSVSALYSPDLFKDEVLRHENLMLQCFNKKCKVFANSALIYKDVLIDQSSFKVFNGVIVNSFENENKKNKSESTVLVNNDLFEKFINKHFSEQQKPNIPELVESFVKQIKEKVTINSCALFFIDYEYFGAYLNKASGVSQFLEELLLRLTKQDDILLKNPTEITASNLELKTEIRSVSETVGNISSTLRWNDNNMQKDALKSVLNIESQIKSCKEVALKITCYKLLAIEHFISMRTGGEKNKSNYSSSFKSSFDAFISYMNILSDFKAEIANLNVDSEMKEEYSK